MDDLRVYAVTAAVMLVTLAVALGVVLFMRHVRRWEQVEWRLANEDQYVADTKVGHAVITKVTDERGTCYEIEMAYSRRYWSQIARVGGTMPEGNRDVRLYYVTTLPQARRRVVEIIEALTEGKTISGRIPSQRVA